MASEPKSLIGQIVAITGAARGIGRGTAEILVRHGAKVAIGDIETEMAEQTASDLGPSAKAYNVDVTDRLSVDRFLDGVVEDFGRVDVVINNAGIMPVGPFLEESDEVAHRQIDINLHGVIYGTKGALHRMLPANRGHIINIASAAGKTGYPGIATYSATKHAVVGLSEAVRAETLETGIDVSVVMPVLVNTELGSGVEPGRLVRKLEAEDVAQAIVDTIRKPKFEVPVPRETGAMVKGSRLLPRKAQDRLAQFLGTDTMLTDFDAEDRSAYDGRIGQKRDKDARPADAKSGEREPEGKASKSTADKVEA
ncbi:MAG: SDR family oxidoreductase [Solirubrobacterales bacterium]